MTAPGPSPGDFDFALPDGLIAERPASPRDSARLLDLTGAGPADRRVSDLAGLLRPGDLLLCNDTRVIPARLRGRRGDAKVEVTLHREESPGVWRAFARPARKLAAGAAIDFAPGFSAAVADRLDGGEVRLRFDRAGADLALALDRHGEMPLPPYIRRPGGADDRDRADYQTLFAARDGAVAAPTAGLHFTPALVDALAARQVELARVTLHVGAGTFLPVRADDLRDHRMHAEWGEIGPETAARIAATRAAGGRVACIGTTTLRVLETAAADDGTVRPWRGETTLFILPGYRFKAADLLLTNFHLPRSTLFMLVCAFAGTERMKAAYAHAVAAGYRFYSYGDACLLDRRAA